MANNFRTDRISMEIKREVNEILQKKVRDPRVQGVTITDVQMLGDLSMAKVYYTIMSNLASDNQKAQTGLEKATAPHPPSAGHDRHHDPTHHRHDGLRRPGHLRTGGASRQAQPRHHAPGPLVAHLLGGGHLAARGQGSRHGRTRLRRLPTDRGR